jgi:hypothetical protein
MDTEKLKSLLKTLEADLKIYRDSMKEVSRDIMKEGFSEHPVFIAHQHEVNLGEEILNKDEFAGSWTINATTLEELIEKKVVLPERTEDFKKAYKDPAKFMCIFMITEEGGNFIFLPYKEGKQDLSQLN